MQLSTDDPAWELRTRGQWQARADGRALLAMRHPWVTSTTGDHAQAVRFVETPSTWTGPIYLSFYCSDDYQALPETDTAPGWLSGEGFVGHRFKQVMVNGTVVWSADVADAIVAQQEALRYRIALPVTPGERFMLALLTYDTEASSTLLDGDFHDPGDKDQARENDPSASHFMTHVYWGDIALSTGDTVVPSGTRPDVEAVRAVHARRWPVPAFGAGFSGDLVTLQVSAPAGIPKPGFPLCQGIPLPPARVDDVGALRLQTATEGAVYAQKTVLRSDPDGALRWIEFDMPVDAGTESRTLAFAKDYAKPRHSAQITDTDAGLDVEAGISFATGDVERLLSRVRNGKDSVLDWVMPLLRITGAECATMIDTVSVVSEGPFHVMLAADGLFEHEGTRMASFTVYISAYAGLPNLRLLWRVFNDTEDPLHAEAMTLRFRFGEAPDAWRVPGPGEPTATLHARQETEHRCTVNGKDETSEEPFYVAWDGGCIAPRWFRERYPSAVDAEGNTLDLHFAAGRETPIVFTPGEAATHEVWLALGGVDPKQFAATVAQPPVLCNPDYFCATGVLGPARPAALLPGLAQDLGASAAKDWTALGYHFGIRHFPDTPYIGGLPNWTNDYPSAMLNLWSAWFMTGNRAWYDRAEAVSRHLTDVAVIHSDVPGNAWTGGMHGPGANHVPGPWNPILRNNGLGLFAAITASPGAEEAFWGLADFCTRTGAGMDAGSSRHHAAPLDTAAEAWFASGDLAFRDEALRRVQALAKHIDTRRGAWPETHGSRVYRGNVPWMLAQLARPLYWCYTLTGDVTAAQTLVGLAESVAWENVDWNDSGNLANYSHNPRYAPIPQLDTAVLPLLLAGYTLSEDSYLLDTAKAIWSKQLEEPTPENVFGQFWNMPWLLDQLNELGLLPLPQTEEEVPAPN